jgi:hypothetical protein
MDETVRKFHSVESFEALVRERVKPIPGDFDGYSEHAERMSLVRFVSAPASLSWDYWRCREHRKWADRMDLELA